MLTKKLINSWNGLFSDCRITETDLFQPSEDFLTRTLIHYLRKIGYVVELPNDSSRERRKFLVKLAWNVQSLFKITDESHVFTYYDLLNPTPHKTSRMLGILLNYLYYLNMYRNDVISIVNNRLNSRQEYLRKIKHGQEEKDQLSIKYEKLQKEEDSITKELSQKKAEFEKLNLHKINLTEQLQQSQESTKQSHAKINALVTVKRPLDLSLASRKEAKELLQGVKQLQESSKEQEQININLQSNLKKEIHEVKTFQDMLKNIEAAKGVITPNRLENYQQSQQKLGDMNTYFVNLNDKERKLLENIKWMNQSLKVVKENQEIAYEQFYTEKQNKIQIIKNEHKICKTLEQQLKTLQINEHLMEPNERNRDSEQNE